MKWKEIGLVGLATSRKATFCCIVLAISAVALFTHKLDSTTFGVIISVLGSTWLASHSYQTSQMYNSPYPPGYNPNQPNIPYPPNENNLNPAKPLDVPQPPIGV